MLGLQVRLHQPPADEKKLAGNTEVDVGIEVAVGTLVACNSVYQALTCRWVLLHVIRLRPRSPTRLPPASRASLEYREGQQSPGSYIRNERSSEFLFRPAGRHLSVDGSTVTRLRVSRKCRTIWPTLHRLCCSSQSSQSRSRRSGAAVSFQLLRANFKPPLSRLGMWCGPVIFGAMALTVGIDSCRCAMSSDVVLHGIVQGEVADHALDEPLVGFVQPRDQNIKVIPPAFGSKVCELTIRNLGNLADVLCDLGPQPVIVRDLKVLAFFHAETTRALPKYSSGPSPNGLSPQ